MLDSIDEPALGAQCGATPRVPGATTTRPFGSGTSYTAPVAGTISPACFVVE